MITVWIATVEQTRKTANSVPQQAVFTTRRQAEGFINELLAMAGSPRIITLVEKPVNQEEEAA